KVREQVNKFLTIRKKENATLNILATALHAVINAQNIDLVKAYIEYTKAGEYRIKGPMRLLSG
ncbi:hypothetical protein MHBO_005257, partial [Bonamia ostreae]